MPFVNSQHRKEYARIWAAQKRKKTKESEIPRHLRTDFYVYRYYDPIRNEPIYIGKGHDKRAFAHLKTVRKNTPFTARIKWLRKQGVEPIVEFVATELTEIEAMALEPELISKIGRDDLGTGPLLNLTGGGEGFANLSPEQCKKISERVKLKWNEPGYKERLSKIISEAMKAVVWMPEDRQRMSEQSKMMWQDSSVRPKLMAVRKRQGDEKRGVERNVNRKHYIVTFPDGHIEKVFGLKPFCKKYSLDARTMFRVLKREVPSYKGFVVQRRAMNDNEMREFFKKDIEKVTEILSNKTDELVSAEIAAPGYQHAAALNETIVSERKCLDAIDKRAK